MSDAELRNSVLRIKAWLHWQEKSKANFDPDGLKDLNVLLSLAELVLDAKVPEKRELIKIPQTILADASTEGFNQAIDACRLIIARDYVKKSEIEELKEKAWKYDQLCK